MSDKQSSVPKALVIEDNGDLAETYSIWLEQKCDVHTATRGTAGLSWFDPSIDVVLLDRRLPDIAGDRVCREIRSRDDDVQIALITAIEPGEDLVDIPCDDYLVKPVTKDDVLDTVRELLLRSQLDEELQRHFAIASKMAALENSSSNDADAAITDLRRQAERTRARIDERLSELDDFEAAFQTIDG